MCDKCVKVYEKVCETQDSSSALLDLSNDTPISENGHNWLQLLTHVQKFDFWVHCAVEAQTCSQMPKNYGVEGYVAHF